MNFTETDLLLDDRLAPMTTRMGFFKADCSSISDEFYDWRNEIKTRDDVFVSKKTIFSNLESTILSILPLRLPGSSRYLFIPTASEWTAYIGNQSHGTDPSAIGYMAERCGTMSIFTVTSPHTLHGAGKSKRGRQGALIIEVYGPHQTEWLNLVRVIRLYNDVGKWHFEQKGDPFPFEETDNYSNRRLKDRFTFEMFRDYMAEFGIYPFKEGFYLPDPGAPAVLVELSGDLPEKERDVSFEEARKLNGIDD